MKRPSFQFYPGDWQKDAALRMCSVSARGLWIDMLCIMHQGSPYGWLKVGGKVVHVDNLSRMVGATTQEVTGWLHELEASSVFRRGDDGCIYSKRMVDDEKLRIARASGGILGGNPKLKKEPAKVALKVAMKVNHPPNLEPTPSSSSSSSSSSNIKKQTKKPTGFLLSEFLETCKTNNEPAISSYKPLWDYTERVGIPKEWVVLAWRMFRRKFADANKRYLDWRQTFRNYIEFNYLRLWTIDATGQCLMTSIGFAELKHSSAEKEMA